MIDACREEVEGLHRFIEDWLRGSCERSPAAYEPIERALDESFVILHPCGSRSSRAELLPAFFEAHATGGPELRVRIRHREARELGPDLALVVYEEWHLGPETNGRLSSALFRVEDGTPRWLHLHESRLEGEPPES